MEESPYKIYIIASYLISFLALALLLLQSYLRYAKVKGQERQDSTEKPTTSLTKTKQEANVNQAGINQVKNKQ